MEWYKRKRRFASAVWTVGLCLMAVAAQATNVQPAVAVIAHFQNTLLAAMKKGAKLGFQGRYRVLAPAVRESHDLAYIAQVTVGPYWPRLSPAQRAAFVRVFTRLTVATYAAQFKRYSGEHFKETAAHAVGRGDVLVETELLAHRHKEATLDYLLAPSGANWKIVNIVANGVSDLALKRAQYTAIIRRKGFPALLGLLRTKVAQLSHAPKAG
jgi:phospholipid transport system substrate-binding protein